jgi:uncharacterized protein (DUF1778 family)
MTRPAHRAEKLVLRLSQVAKQALQSAATAERKSVSKFVLDAALSEAEERLADRGVFTIAGKRWDAFVAALDALPRRHRALKDCFARRRCSIQKAKRDGFASHRNPSPAY